MEFSEALSITLALAQAARATAETGKEVTEEKIDEALAMVEERLRSIQSQPASPRVPR